MTAATSQRPRGICQNCWAVFRAARPRPEAIYCHHRDVIARRTPSGWKTAEEAGRDDAAFLRARGLL